MKNLETINAFYGKVEIFEALFYTLNGFLYASVGFSSVHLLNENVVSFKL